jgi:hypothetical protein
MGTPHEGAESAEAAGVLLLRLAIATGLFLAISRTWVDPDLWGHLRFGDDILSGGLPQVDTYSFTSDIPWINHEWLAEVVMYLAWAAAGAAGLIALKTIVVLATLAIVVAILRAEVPNQALRDFLIFVTVAGIWIRIYVVRPQIFSLLLFAALLSCIRAADGASRFRLWVIPLLFAVWVNLHGGWIVGLGAVGVWTAFTLMRPPHERLPAALLIGVATLSVAATFVNPYGWRMWTFLFETVGLDRPMIDDWRPVFRSGIGPIVTWILTTAVAAVAFVRRRPGVRPAYAAIVIGLGAASIRVVRLDAFFTLSVVMLLAAQIGAVRETRRIPQARPLWNWKSVIAGCVFAAGGAIVMIGARTQFYCVSLGVPWMPERESVAFIAENKLEGRLITWFNWGEYAIWHFAPHLRVSLDGRRETVYSSGFVNDHLKLYFEPSSQTALLRRLDANYAWLPRDFPLVATLQQEGWKQLFSGPVSVVLGRGPITRGPAVSPQTPACFPGP